MLITYQCLIKFVFVKKATNTLLVACMIIIKLSHYNTMLSIARAYVKSYDGQTKCTYF